MSTSPEQPSLPDGRVRVPEHVVRRAYGDQTVALNLQTGQYHGLNQTAARMLDELEAGGDPAAAAERLAAELQTPLERVRSDLARLCAALAERGLIELEP